MKAWFLRFSLREQVALLLMAAAVSSYLLVMFLLLPQQRAREELLSRNRATAEALQRVDAMATELRALRAAGAGSGRPANRNLSALLNANANRFELRINRLQPNSRGAVQLRFESAPLEALLRFVHGLETDEGLRVEELSLSQTANPGIVSATLRVSAAS